MHAEDPEPTSAPCSGGSAWPGRRRRLYLAEAYFLACPLAPAHVRNRRCTSGNVSSLSSATAPQENHSRELFRAVKSRRARATVFVMCTSRPWTDGASPPSRQQLPPNSLLLLSCQRLQHCKEGDSKRGRDEPKKRVPTCSSLEAPEKRGQRGATRRPRKWTTPKETDSEERRAKPSQIHATTRGALSIPLQKRESKRDEHQGAPVNPTLREQGGRPRVHNRIRFLHGHFQTDSVTPYRHRRGEGGGRSGSFPTPLSANKLLRRSHASKYTGRINRRRQETRARLCSQWDKDRV